MRGKLFSCGLLGFIFFTFFAGLAFGEKVTGREQDSQSDMQQNVHISITSSFITIFMCGDVMTGRGIDQVLPHPGNPLIHEPYVRSATEYVELAERRNGPISKPVSFSYLWGNTNVFMSPLLLSDIVLNR